METLLEGKHAGQRVDDSVLGVESRVPLRISTSDIITAGSGILVEGQVQGNEEIFRVTQTLVTVQYVNPQPYNQLVAHLYLLSYLHADSSLSLKKR